LILLFNSVFQKLIILQRWFLHWDRKAETNVEAAESYLTDYLETLSLHMLKITYPSHDFRIRKENNREIIFDEVRRRWVTLTPEEWVRQNFLQYLLRVKNYPRALLSVEKLIKLGELRKRCDIVVYKEDRPWMIVECKEMNAGLNLPVLEQILRYNIAHQVEYLVMTNGRKSFAYQLAENSFCEIEELPAL
jgi:hypothetical protein